MKQEVKPDESARDELAEKTRSYRKGSPASAAERKRNSLKRLAKTHRALHAMILIEHKEALARMADREGITQGKMLEKLIAEGFFRRHKRHVHK